MQRTTIFLPDLQMKRLQRVAGITDMKAAEHIRRAIDSYLDVIEDRIIRSSLGELKEISGFSVDSE